MITNAETAKKVSALMLDIFHRLDESIVTVRNNCSSEEAAAYQKAVGRVVGPIVMDVLEPLYEQHPTLKPHNWDE
jgi:hypothetical protein